MTDHLPYAKLGALVRERREQTTDLSMSKLADQANLGRSSLHRLEHGVGEFQLRPDGVARVLTILGITVEEIEQLVEDGEWRDDLLLWMQRVRDVREVRRFVEERAGRERRQPDLVLLHDDGTVVTVEIKHAGAHNGDDEAANQARIIAQIARALETYGYQPNVPVGTAGPAGDVSQ